MAANDTLLQVSMEETTVLGRKLKIEIPAQDVQAAYQTVVQKAQKSLKLPGFRPGRVPKGILEKRYHDMLQAEVLQNLAPTHLQRALEQLSLTPATKPHVHDIQLDKERPLVFEAEFEVVPEFEKLDVFAVKLKPVKVAVEDAQIEERIKTVRKSHATPAEKDGRALKGDLVLFDFSGRLDGESFEGGSAQDQKIELGQGRFLEAFETALLGMQKGESKTFPLTFPKEYQAPNLAGKEVEFQVVVKQVSKLVAAPMNKEFFSRFGPFEDEAAFREHMKGEIIREQERENQQAQQGELAEHITQHYDFPLPAGLVKDALQNYERQMQQKNPAIMKDKEKWEAAQKEETERVEKALRLGYVIEAAARERNLEPDANAMRERFMMQAQMMRQEPQKLINTELGERLLMQIRERLLHERTLETLCEEALGQTTPKAAGSATAKADTPKDTKANQTTEKEEKNA